MMFTIEVTDARGEIETYGMFEEEDIDGAKLRMTKMLRTAHASSSGSELDMDGIVRLRDESGRIRDESHVSEHFPVS